LDVLGGKIDGQSQSEEDERAIHEAQLAVWVAVRKVCVLLLGEEEFEREIRMARTGPDPFELMASSDADYLAASAVLIAIGWELDLRMAEVVSRCAAEAISGSIGDTKAGDREYAIQAELLRDIIGNPFHPRVFEPQWRTSTVLAIAEGIYEDRAFDRLPILADALQEAGCEDEQILGHCREDGTHVRGCWVIDLILGRQ
jgi:hypothetical protein